MRGPEDRLRGALERLATPADPSGAYERIVEKKVRRRILRRLEMAGLAVAVLAGTVGGTFALAQVFRTTPKRVPVAPTVRNGKIAFVTNRDGNNEIYVMNANGTGARNLTNSPADDHAPAWSPDGQQIAFASNREQHTHIYIMSADGTNVTRLTKAPTVDDAPAWSPDGKWMAFTRSAPESDQQPNGELWLMRANGSDQRRLTSDGQTVDRDSRPSWSPDSGEIAFAALEPFTSPNCPPNAPCPLAIVDRIEVIDADGTSARTLTGKTENQTDPAWSPDGSRIAFTSGGRLFVMDTDGREVHAITDGSPPDHSPAWSPDGTMLAFVSDGDGATALFVIKPNGMERAKLRDLAGPEDGSPSWQPLPVGSATPHGTPSPPSETPSPEPLPSPSPAWPLPRCATSFVNGDFDGDGNLDTAAVCRLKGGTFSLNVRWAGGASGAVSLPDCQSVCEARGAGDLNGDDIDEFFLVFSAGAATEFVEVYELPTTEIFGQHPARIAPPGSPPGFPAGEPAQFDLGGSVTHQGYLTCATAQGGTPEILSTGTVLSEDQTTWKVHETTFTFSPGKDGLGQFTVVSVRDATAPFDPESPFLPAGDPCLDI